MDPTDVVMGYEGFTPKATWDYKQWTNGYGTKARYPGEVIGQDEARTRLATELQGARNAVSQRFPNLAPNQTAALTSFTYNLGPGWMNQPTRLRAAIEAGDHEGAARIMQEYNKAGGSVLPGLAKRRAGEAALYLGGPMPAGQPPATTATPSQGSAPMTPMTPYDGPSPDDVAQSRRLAQMLMGQAVSSEPVQHWTQALGRVLQGGVGGMYAQQASQGEKQGRASLASALTGNPSPAALVANGWAGDIGPKLFMQQQAQNTPMAQAQLTGAQLDNAVKARDIATPKADRITVEEGKKVFAFDPRNPTAPATLVADGGSPKMTPDEHKAILEADKELETGRSALSNIRRIRELNKSAYSGVTAGARSAVFSQLGEKGAVDTEEMKNLIVNQALETLRATFGGNPTEGERKILIDVQGSVNQPAQVRDRIFQRAEQMVMDRARMAMQRSQQLRDRSYFQPGGGQMPTAPAAPAAAPQAPAPAPQDTGAAPDQAAQPSTYVWSPDKGIPELGVGPIGAPMETPKPRGYGQTVDPSVPAWRRNQ